ncbi:AbrB/MazE/SpoVT family DNA-binding domain-containing protein [Natranaeroarchaeum sulfidigenes]|uniref:AbrB family transcriptional regulator n=1 Tax=Natranaeroarchaeum sulfidigenes TaxID=2784880 RepID=A0A897MIQ5_9EURY|nr:AbrB/MazE/SpoVT family DNA-binding domain-containing protein [Natranaeroarchaeum sulfidigenes]QSG02000.1 AbrB family transcriptional regulator [Natranaeroarchaeum sulfidigenes]
MVQVDAKGRIVLPKELRERLGIAPGTEVEVREEDGKAVVEPEPDPEQVIERMERLVGETGAESDLKPLDDVAPSARRHREAVERGAREGDR